MDDTAKCNDADERYGEIIDIDAEETPYSDLDSKPAAKPTAARTTAATPTATRNAEGSNLHMCEMSWTATIVGTVTNTESAEVLRPPLRIVANCCCLNPFLLATELLKYQPEIVVAIEEDRTLWTCMIKRLGPST